MQGVSKWQPLMVPMAALLPAATLTGAGSTQVSGLAAAPEGETGEEED